MSFKDDDLIELVLEQINRDQENLQLEALYDFIDLIDREEMIIYLGKGLRKRALEQGIIAKGEVPNDE